MAPFTIFEIPFSLRGLPGEATVEHGLNDDPTRWGFGRFVLGEAYPPEMARGFPVIQASVAYEGEGYAAVMGWVQVVQYRLHDVGTQVTVFDVAPQISDSDVPYAAFGVRPTFFDAPGITNPEVTWKADAFLVHTPDGVLSRVIRAICGFTWGYLVRGGKVEALPCVRAGEADWERNLPDLRQRYPTWTFGSAWSA